MVTHGNFISTVAGTDKERTVNMPGSKCRNMELTAGMKKLSLEVSRLNVTTVSKHLRRWLEVHVNESTTVQARQPKYASLKKALLTWFNDIRDGGVVASNVMLTEKAKLYGSLPGKLSFVGILCI